MASPCSRLLPSLLHHHVTSNGGACRGKSPATRTRSGRQKENRSAASTEAGANRVSHSSHLPIEPTQPPPALQKTGWRMSQTQARDLERGSAVHDSFLTVTSKTRSKRRGEPPCQSIHAEPQSSMASMTGHFTRPNSNQASLLAALLTSRTARRPDEQTRKGLEN